MHWHLPCRLRFHASTCIAFCNTPPYDILNENQQNVSHVSPYWRGDRMPCPSRRVARSDSHCGHRVANPPGCQAREARPECLAHNGGQAIGQQCLVCGQDILVPGVKPKQRTCSAECYREYRSKRSRYDAERRSYLSEWRKRPDTRERQRRHNLNRVLPKPKEREPRSCPVCGSTFSCANPARRYCSTDCRQRQACVRRASATRPHRPKAPKTRPPATCLVCGTVVSGAGLQWSCDTHADWERTVKCRLNSFRVRIARLRQCPWTLRANSILRIGRLLERKASSRNPKTPIARIASWEEACDLLKANSQGRAFRASQSCWYKWTHSVASCNRTRARLFND